MQEQLEERTETKQSQVLTRSWLCLHRVWIGRGPGLDRARLGPTSLRMLQVGCNAARKGRQGGKAAAGQLGCLALKQCQLGSLTA